MVWTPIANLTGPAVEMRKSATHVQWRVEGSSDDWTDLLALADIQGLPGTGAVPADTAVAGYVSTLGSSDTQDALDARFPRQIVTGMLASENGVPTDGSDAGPALNTLLTTAATFGVPVVMEPGTTVSISTTVNPPSGTRWNLNGCTIQTLGVGAIDFRPIIVIGVSDVHIFGGTVDGNKAAYATATEQRHNIMIRHSDSVTIRDVVSFNAKGDGIYVGDDSAGLSTDIHIDNVTCSGNYRQGMSISHVSGMTVTNSTFKGTAGTNPQAGVDIEPNVDGIVCEDIKFVGCAFTGNAHFGLVISLRSAPSVRQGGIDLVACNIRANGVAADTFGGGINLRNARDFTMVGGCIAFNQGPGVQADSASVCVGVSLTNVHINDNYSDGVLVTGKIDRLVVMGCTIDSNGRTLTNTYSGITLTPNASMTAPRIIGNVLTSSRQKYGVLTNSNVSRLVLLGNETAFNGTAAYSLSDDAATRNLNDGANGYYSGAKVIAAAGIGVGNSASATAVGTLSKKMQIFDATGASIGYVPIYTTIT